MDATPPKSRGSTSFYESHRTIDLVTKLRQHPAIARVQVASSSCHSIEKFCPFMGGMWQTKSTRHIRLRFLTCSRPDSQTLAYVKVSEKERQEIKTRDKEAKKKKTVTQGGTQTCDQANGMPCSNQLSY